MDTPEKRFWECGSTSRPGFLDLSQTLQVAYLVVPLPGPPPVIKQLMQKLVATVLGPGWGLFSRTSTVPVNSQG